MVCAMKVLRVFAMLDSVGRVYQVDDSVAVCAAEHFLRPTRFASGDDQGDLCAGGSLRRA